MIAWVKILAVCPLLFASTVPSKSLPRLLDTSPARPVRVLLMRESNSFKVSSLINALYYKHDSFGYWVDIPKDATISVRNFKGEKRIALGETILKRGALYLRGGTKPADKIRINNSVFRGAIKITETKGKLFVTNILPLEDYIKGTLAAEMNGSWDMEALKSQAVASRTYAVYMTRHPKHSLYDLERDTQDQVYAGVEVESRKISTAVDGTKGLILTQGNSPIKAYFHSRCGGKTETEKAVWNTSGGLAKTSVSCPYCQKNPKAWRATITLAELLKGLGFEPKKESPVRIVSSDRSPSGRVESLTFMSGDRKKELSSNEFRNILGYSRVKSTRFDWKLMESQIELLGTGAGHGVGMCQWGAQGLAKNGKSFREILAHYYPGVAITQFESLNI